jgi:hypothetical protein
VAGLTTEVEADGGGRARAFQQAIAFTSSFKEPSSDVRQYSKAVGNPIGCKRIVRNRGRAEKLPDRCRRHLLPANLAAFPKQ